MAKGIHTELTFERAIEATFKLEFDNRIFFSRVMLDVSHN